MLTDLVSCYRKVAVFPDHISMRRNRCARCFLIGSFSGELLRPLLQQTFQGEDVANTVSDWFEYRRRKGTKGWFLIDTRFVVLILHSGGYRYRWRVWWSRGSGVFPDTEQGTTWTKLGAMRASVKRLRLGLGIDNTRQLMKQVKETAAMALAS